MKLIGGDVAVVEVGTGGRWFRKEVQYPSIGRILTSLSNGQIRRWLVEVAWHRVGCQIRQTRSCWRAGNHSSSVNETGGIDRVRQKKNPPSRVLRVSLEVASG
jgi:hypothetical protein